MCQTRHIHVLWIAVNYIYLLIPQFQFPHKQRHRLLCTFCGELLDCDIIEVERKGLPALREIWLSAPQGRLWFISLFPTSICSNLLIVLWRSKNRVDALVNFLAVMFSCAGGYMIQLTGLNIMFTNCYWTPGHEITEAIFCICFCCVESKGNLLEITARCCSFETSV